MKVEGTGPVRAANARRPARGTSADGAGFALEMARTGDGVTASSGVAAPGIAALLALQATDDAGQRSKRARLRAHFILDRLDEIRTALLTGQLHQGSLGQLQELVAHARDGVEDPRLVEILDEIDLRASVELAKLEMLPG